jgi:gluconokinase
MSGLQLRSPAAKVEGLIYFGRMIDKIRENAAGKLPPEYQANLGTGFDANCTTFLRIDYHQLVERVEHGGSDEDILHWCYALGRQPSTDEVHVWNEFMRKRGWHDEVAEFLTRRKKEAGMAGRSEIKTMFEFIDVDEGRSLPDALGVERKV